jgi:tRNA dimethylallyltransferase
LIPAILLMGPTASGKSVLALALAERLDGEIVTTDSAQVYRGMDIGTAKPSTADRARVPHHLIDIIDPTQRYSAAQFTRDAHACVAQIRARGKTPILSGGTMLYFKALTEGLSALPHADANVRAELDRRALIEGWPSLHAELARVDSVTAGRLAPTDAQRIQRALEVYRLSGQPISLLQGKRKTTVGTLGPTVGTLGPTVAIALVPTERARLHAAIAERFQAMLDAGLVDELRGLRQHYALDPDLPSMRCVGYRQAWRFLDGAINHAQLFDMGVAATRQLAKRQLTWLRSTPASVFESTRPDLADAVVAVIGARIATMTVGSDSNDSQSAFQLP